MNYTGYKEITPSDEELALFYSNPNTNYYELYTNEYLVIKDNSGKPIDKYKWNGNAYEKVKFHVLGNDFTGKIKPRNAQQELFFDMLKDDSINIKLVTGRFGSGKSIGMITASLEAVMDGKFEKIVFIRNNVQVKDTDALGALPGGEYQKLLPYVMPFADHCGGTEGVQNLIDSGQLEVIPLGFLRGRSIKNSIIYAMESENLTKQHIQLLMGRVDEGSQLWMDGDIKQRDRTAFEKSQGLEIMIDCLKDEKLFGYVHLEKSERSATAALADKLD